MSAPTSEIRFFQTPSILRDRSALRRFLSKLFKRERRDLSSLNYIFCSDAELLQINQQFLSHDDYTDIITFELSPKGTPVEGEIYISIDRVRENAQIHGTSVSRELHRVVFHGALHLCGFKDKSSREAAAMRAKEEEYLQRYFG